MHLCLYLPGLLERAAAAPPHVLRAFAHRIAQVQPTIARDGAIASLAPHYGIERQQDWPMAALRARAAGFDTAQHYWLRATPVLLEPGRDDVRVVGAVTDIDPAQASAFIATLHQHFAPDGISFMLASAHDWLVAVDRVPALATRPVMPAIGDRVRAHLATGDDAGMWRRWGQEIEMLLHDHPANGVREQQGRTIVNSVWWQHGGVHPPPRSMSVQTWSDDEDLRALAQHVGAPARPSIEDANEIWREGRSNDIVISADARYDLNAMETRLVAPILDALDAGRIASVYVIADAPGKAAVRWHLERRAWWTRVLGNREASLGETVAQLQGALTAGAP